MNITTTNFNFLFAVTKLVITLLSNRSVAFCSSSTRKVQSPSAFASRQRAPARHHLWQLISGKSQTASTAVPSRSFSSLAMTNFPVPRREEDRFVFAGVAPPGWDAKIPRQSEESSEKLMDPPVPIPDPYGWMRDMKRENQEVLDHLKAENKYTQSVIKHLEPLQKQLYEEFLSSIQETDYTTPRPRGDYWYYSRTFEGKSYPQYCRAPKLSNTFKVEWDGSKQTPILQGEEVYLDVNVLAEGKSYCSIGTARLSPSQKLLAYSVDYKGDETYQVHIVDLETRKEYPLNEVGGDKLLETSGTVLWGKDESTLFYMTMDETHRPYRFYSRQNWNSDIPVDKLLKEELDDVYWSHASKSLDRQYVFFESASSETSEVWFLKLDDRILDMQCVARRRSKVLYEVEHGDGKWWIWTNVNSSPNMKLMKSPAKADCASEWEMVLDADGKPAFDGSMETALDSVTVLKTHVVAEGRQDGIPRVWFYEIDSKNLERLEFDEPAHDVSLAAQYEFNTTSIAVGYDSLVTPPQSIEIRLASPSSDRKVLKSKQVPGYTKELYGCDRIHVRSRDGTTDIPISVVYRKDVMERVKAGERAPTHLYGYGSYGSCCEADFSSTRLPLLERGMIYVIAHIRGGGEMGRAWYEEPSGGKYLCKKNTFFDFCDIAKYLVKNWTSPEILSCEGRSAGGLLIGASINLEPELFRVAILGVPFVDVVSTMLDASIPLTAGEWVEWGNPNEEKYYQYMMEYSPMNNVKSGVQYPSCWLTGGLHDPRVQYWEPAKFVATIRHANPDGKNPVCVKMDMSAGHFSASDRYKYLKELSIDYSFLLDQLGLVKEP